MLPTPTLVEVDESVTAAAAAVVFAAVAAVVFAVAGTISGNIN